MKSKEDFNSNQNSPFSDYRKSRRQFNPGKMVQGANPLSHFNVRCPCCHKLFRVESRDIKSASPYFDCTVCKTRFTFDFPPKDLKKIETKVVSQKDSFQLQDSVDKESLPNELKTCPKCEALNPRLSKECIKCGVLFEKVEDLPMDAKLGAIPSLVKAWQELMSDYSNATKHVEFVHRCEDLHALPFALKKYQTLKELQPQDDMAKQMFHQVFLKNIKKNIEEQAGKNSFIRENYEQLKTRWQNFSERVNWLRIRKFSPIFIGMSMMLLGHFLHGSRNLMGAGAAILFLTVGLTLFIKGRISLDDFW